MSNKPNATTIKKDCSRAVLKSEIDLASTHNDLVQIEQSIKDATRTHNKFLKELGLSPLP